jgi:acyl-CoA synthetase (NDP forming)/GNAT superfamily N-acetyltransferase
MEAWGADVVLSDGATVHVRATSAADTEAIVAFHERQSRDSNYKRYFSHHPKLSAADIKRFTESDFVSKGVLAAVDGTMLIGIGGWYRWPDRADADVAFQVDDAHQRRGLATVLLEHLAASAKAAGIVRFTAETFTDNTGMLSVFTRAGWPVQRRFASGLIELSWELQDTTGYLDSVEAREQRADSRSMARFLLPRSIVIIGASDQAGSVGKAITSAVLGSSFAGPIHLVNPARSEVAGRATVASIDDVEGPIDLALIAVPDDAIDAVVRQCALRRVRGAVLLSAPSQPIDELVAHARLYGLRLVGPASMGFISTSPQAALSASLSSLVPRRGRVALSLQSGPLGAALLQQANDLQLGLSWFVSLGERSDVSGNDLLQFWQDDTETSVIALYTERFGNPRKFARIARRVARTRPIIAVESDEEGIGDALYLQAGVIRVPTVAELLDTARVFASLPLPTGPRVAIVSNATSPDRLTRKALHAAGLEAVAGGRLLSWDADDDSVANAIQAALMDDGVDAVLVIHTPPVPGAAASLGPVIERAASAATKPVVAVILGGKEGPVAPDGVVPGFAFPEPAARALGRLWSYAKWRADELRQPAVPGHADADADPGLRELLAVGEGWMNPAAAAAVLRAAGIAVPETLVVESDVDATRAADHIGYPVVVKRLGNRPLGRSVGAGVALDLTDAAVVAVAFTAIHDLGGTGPIVVQPMQQPGLEVRLTVLQHPALGPILSVGPGGQAGGILGRHPQRLLPLSPSTIADLLAESRLTELFTVHDVDPALLTDLIARLSDFATANEQVASVILDPVLVSATSCSVSDASVEVHPPTPDAALRQLDPR